MRRTKSQSAMEYLMTYGWAILVIAVVLAILYQIGVFNSNLYTPKTQTGSCLVVRSGGALSEPISLTGACNKGIPMTVAKFRNDGSVCCGAAGGAPLGVLGQNFTVSQWFYINSPTGGSGGYSSSRNPIMDMYYATGGSTSDDYGGSWAGGTGGNFGWAEYWPQNNQFCDTGSGTIMPYKWYNAVAAVTNYNSVSIYINGVLSTTCSFAISINSNPSLLVSVGSNPPGGLTINANEEANALISNVQIYNSTLSANDISTVYMEGIGGAPVDLNYLMGWWPLNGDVNDYSGNMFDMRVVAGAGTFSYLGGWTGGYTPP